MRFFVVFASIAAALAAEHVLFDPIQDVYGCTTHKVSWTGGVAPYTFKVYAERFIDDHNGRLVQTIKNIKGTSLDWKVTEAVGTTVYFTVEDKNGDETDWRSNGILPGHC